MHTPISRSHSGLTLFTLCVSVLITFIFWSCDEISSDDTASNTETSELTPLINSNTNWLLSCNEDTDCDEGESCSCGSCVIPCEETRGCSIDPRDMMSPRVACAMSDPVYELDSCGDDYRGPMTSICLPQCESNEECPRDLVCYEGRCKRPRREGCLEARRCLEEGRGGPETCRELCAAQEMVRMDNINNMSNMPPAATAEDLRSCTNRCVETRSDEPEECQRRCMICEERCRFLDLSPMECMGYCQPR